MPHFQKWGTRPESASGTCHLAGTLQDMPNMGKSENTLSSIHSSNASNMINASCQNSLGNSPNGLQHTQIDKLNKPKDQMEIKPEMVEIFPNLDNVPLMDKSDSPSVPLNNVKNLENMNQNSSQPRTSTNVPKSPHPGSGRSTLFLDGSRGSNNPLKKASSSASSIASLGHPPRVPSAQQSRRTRVPSGGRSRGPSGQQTAAHRSRTPHIDTDHPPPRSKSTSARPSKPQTRTLRRNTPAATQTTSNTSSRLAKNQTDVVDGVRNLNVGGSARSNIHARSSRHLGATPRQCKTVEDVARLIANEGAKNIVVMVGAGISTPSGIPDFRTPGTGLYDNLRQYHIPYPQAIFDIDYFEHHPKPFFTLAKELYPTGKYRPNYVHYFLRLLHEKGVLLRVYTQNIDGLERLAGIPQMKIIEAHGTFLLSSCVRCNEAHPSEAVKSAIFNDKIPRCRLNGCFGLVKPNIVFFGEDLPRRFYYYLKDFPQADLLIVMGTSLEVEPFAGIVDAVRFHIPRLLFNREAVGPFRSRSRINDVCAKGDIIRQVHRFAEMLGWTEDLNSLIDQCERKRGYKVPAYDIDGAAGEDDIDSHKTENNSSIVQHTPRPPSAPKKTSNLGEKVSRNGGNALTKRSESVERIGNNRTLLVANRHMNSFSAKTTTEVIQIKNMMKANVFGKNNSNMSSLLPQIARNKPPKGKMLAFHAQTRLYRTDKDEQENAYFSKQNDSDESTESEESDSDEDEDEDD